MSLMIPNCTGRDNSLNGTKIGRLTLVSSFHKPSKWGNVLWWNCLCDCGAETTARLIIMKTGLKLSCGCLRKEMASARSKSMSLHNMSKTPEHRIWSGMIDRCRNPKSKDYRNYGGRGIKVFDGWAESFISFFNHIGCRPSKSHSLDRINNEGNYEPGNVRWATTREQGRNKRGTVLVTINGETASFMEWCDRIGLKDDCARRRIRVYGWSVERAVTTPTIPPRFSRK